MASTAVMGGEVVYVFAKDLDGNARQKAILALASVEVEFWKIGLPITADTITDLSAELKTDTRHSFQWLMDKAESIEQLALKELREKMFLYIPPERAKFWPKMNEPFGLGRVVNSNFPSTTFDANSAAFCLAATLSTASVFHLMRVLEIGLSVL